MSAPTLRRVCAWCDPQHPTDGKGPIQPGEMVSHGICPRAYAVALSGPEDVDPDGDYLGGFGR